MYYFSENIIIFRFSVLRMQIFGKVAVDIFLLKLHPFIFIIMLKLFTQRIAKDSFDVNEFKNHQSTSQAKHQRF
jgi:hypothetical protein